VAPLISLKTYFQYLWWKVQSYFKDDYLIAPGVTAPPTAVVATGATAFAPTASSAAEWMPDDYRALEVMASRLKMNPADLLLVFYSESGGHPWAANKNLSGYPVAVGLNQLTQASNPATGLSEDQRVNLIHATVAQQLPIIEKFFDALQWTKAGKPYPSASAIYAMNFAPARAFARGVNADVVLYDAHDGNFYSANSAFDFQHKGNITVGDLGHHLVGVASRSDYQHALQSLNAATGKAYSPTIAVGATSTPTGPAGPGPGLALALLAGGAALFYFMRPPVA
jgi:hypothetical protein